MSYLSDAPHQANEALLIVGLEHSFLCAQPDLLSGSHRSRIVSDSSTSELKTMQAKSDFSRRQHNGLAPGN
jgi:hypothetical protein